MSKVTPKALKSARDLALEGKTEEAVAALEALVTAGSASAAASLAELQAFRGDWPAVVRCARLVLENPKEAGSANVHNAMIRLLGAAGHSGQPWADIAAAAKSALTRDPAKGFAKLLENLVAYAERSGAPPHELILIFGVAPAAPDPAKYRDAMAAHEATKSQNKPDWAMRAFSLASSFRQNDEMVRIYGEHADALGFAQALQVAIVLANAGQADRAWQTLEPKLSAFWPDDPAQVTPITLVTDGALRALGSKERWTKVLSTRRGPAAKR